MSTVKSNEIEAPADIRQATSQLLKLFSIDSQLDRPSFELMVEELAG